MSNKEILDKERILIQKPEKAQKNQIRAIKLKLASAFRESGLTYYKVRQKLTDQKFWGYDLSYNSVCQTLDPEDERTPNLFAVLGMARMWNLDLTSLLRMPSGDDTVDSQIGKLDDYSKLGGYAPVNQSAYLGRFYGYMSNPNLADRELICFTLDIREEDGGTRTKAELEYSVNPRNIEKKEVKKTFRFSGQVYLVTRTRNIIMLLNNSEGGYMFLAMNYIEHNTLPMYYRPGIAVTSSAAQEDVLALNYILVKEKIKEEKVEEYLPGLLNFTGRQFAVPQESIDRMLKDGDEDIALFMKEMDGYIPGKKTLKKDVLWIKDETVLSIIEDEDKRENLVKALIKLKNCALSQSFIEYKYIPDYTRFGKEFLQDSEKV